MTNTLIGYYKDNCGMKNVLFQSNKVIYHLFSKGSVVIAILIALNILWTINIQNFESFITLAILILSILALFFLFNRKAKKQLFKLYHYESNSILWNSPDACMIIFKEEKRMIENFFDKKYITKEQMKFYRINMDKELESYKPKLVSIPNICGTMLVALYSIALSRLMSLASSYGETEIIIIIGVAVILFFGIMAIFVKFVKEIMLESAFFSRDYKALLQCIELIDEVILESK